MAEALEQVKRQFGRHAMILNTRTLARGGVFGLGGKPYVEITAAPGTEELPAPRRGGTMQSGSGRTINAEGAAREVSPNANMLVSPSSELVMSEVGELKTLVGDLVRETRRANSAQLPGELHDTYHKLIKGAVAQEIAQQLIDSVRRGLTGDQLNNPEIVREQLARAVESMLPAAGPIRSVCDGEPTIIALIGPTGVGKTTTIAKLAANLCLREHRKIGLITIDTYRIAAVEQLRTYAQIIDVPLEVVMSPGEFKDAVARMADRDFVLIDTAGRSQHDTRKICELKEFFAEVRPHEVHLVLSSTCGEAVLLETIRRFRDVGVDRVIFTKLDEAIGFGVILACLQQAQAGLSYVTTGQDVPDDIRVGEGKSLARLILGVRTPSAEAPSAGAIAAISSEQNAAVRRSLEESGGSAAGLD